MEINLWASAEARGGSLTSHHPVRKLESARIRSKKLSFARSAIGVKGRLSGQMEMAVSRPAVFLAT
jgi:hypothetical protein